MQLTRRNPTTNRPALNVQVDPFATADGGTPELPIRRLLSAVVRGKGFIVLSALVGALVAAAMAIAKPNVYESRATFVVKRGSESRGALGNLGTHDISQNAPQIISDMEVFERTVKRVGARKVLAPFQPPKLKAGDDDSWMRQLRRAIYDIQHALHSYDDEDVDDATAAAEVYNSLFVDVSRRAPNVLKVTYIANEPHLAQEVLTAYCEAAKIFHMEVYGEFEAIEMVKRRYQKAKDALRDARTELHDFARSFGVASFEQELSELLESKRDASTEVRQLQTRMRALTSRITKLQAQLLDTPQYKIEETKVEELNPRIPSLETEIQTKENELIVARMDFKQGTPEINNKERVLVLLKKQLVKERATPRTTRTQIHKVLNEDHMLAKKSLSEARTQLEVDKGNLAAAEQLEKVVNTRIRELTTRRPEFENLSAQVEQRSRDLSYNKVELDRVEDKEALSASNQSSLSLVAPPSFLAFRVGPNRTLSTLLGLLAGLGVSIGILLFKALTDTTIRTPDELEQKLGLRVLAVVPQLDRKNIRRHERRLISGC